MAENARGGSYRRVFLGRDGIKKAEEYINKFEIDTHDKFCVAKSENFKIIDGPLLALVNKKIFWEENSSNTIAVLYDGVPFIVIGKQRRECFHGPDRNLGKKKKEMKRKKIHSNSTYQRKRQGQQLKADIQNNTPITVEHQIYCSLPNDTGHQFHVRGEAQVILSQNLKRMFLTKKDSAKIYSSHNIIHGKINKDLARLFQEGIGLAECYLTKVLEKEAMVAILQAHNAVTYKKAESEIMATESKHNADLFNKLVKKYGES